MYSAPIYDIGRSYLDNAEEGPFFKGELPKRSSPQKMLDFLGFPLASPIGVPAGPLLNSKWVGLAANLGFDVLCYKTIRSFEHPGHPLPNVIYVEDFDAHNPPAVVKGAAKPFKSLAITNSFGMPSRSRLYLEQDIPAAHALLHPGQVMIVSVVGTPGNWDFADDFVSAALFAKECGAKIIEANFSCPNVATCEGDIANNPESVFAITSKLTKALKGTPLIIKVGTFKAKEHMQQTLLAAARGGAAAVSGINTISMKVVDEKGLPALGENRLTSGVCGDPIRTAALAFIRNARAIIDQEKLDLKLLGCGGITRPEHFEQFLDLGADLALTATGMMWDPYLADKYHRSHK